MHERVVVADVPQRDDDIPFDAFWARRRRRQFAVGDALGPIGIGFQRSLFALIVQNAVHRVAADAGAETPLPRFRVRLQLRLRLEHVVDRARELIAKLVTEVAIGFQRIDPVILGEHGRPEPVALGAGARKFSLAGRLEQRQPEVSGIDLCGVPWRLGGRRPQRDSVRGRLQRHRRRIDEAVAAYPHRVVGRWQLGQHEAALIVADDDLDEVRRQILGFRDHPDTGFRSVGALDDA